MVNEYLVLFGGFIGFLVIWANFSKIVGAILNLFNFKPSGKQMGKQIDEDAKRQFDEERQQQLKEAEQEAFRNQNKGYY